MPSYSKPCMQLGGAAQDDLGGLQPPKPPPLDPPLEHGRFINPRRAHALVRVTIVGQCVCLSVRTKFASTGIWSDQVLYVRVSHNECKV